MSIKFILPLFSLAMLAACGFQPMYGSSFGGGENAENNISLFNQIAIATIPDRSGQILRNNLIDRMHTGGSPSNARYLLQVAPINEDVNDFDTTIFAVATRRQVVLSTSFILIDRETEQPLLERVPIQSITSYNVLDSEYATLVTEESAREAGLEDMARQIQQQIALYRSRL